MSTIIFEVVKTAAMLTMVIAGLYIIPLIRRVIGEINLNTMEVWAANAVRYAEQWMKTENGEEKREVVTDILQRIREKTGISITDEQINILIEAAVNAMNEINIQYMIEGDTDE